MIGRIASLFLSAAILCAAAQHAAAQEAVFAMDEDVFAMGGDLRVSGQPGGDLIAAGGSVNVAADGALDVIAAAGQLIVDGLIGEDAILAGGNVTLDGRIEEDLILAGGQVRISRNARIGDDALVAGGNVTIDGSVAGDVVMTGGRLAVSGDIAGDLSAAGGQLEILSGARIGGAVSFRGREPPVIAPDATIVGTVDYIAERRFGGRWDDRRGFGWGGRLWLALAMTATGIVVILLIPRIVAHGAERVRTRPVASALIGLAMLAGIPLLAVLLMATVIGIPLGAITMGLFPATLFVGFVVAAFALSEWALRRRIESPTPLQRFAAFAVAVILLVLAYAIPWIGGWLALATLLLGLGALGQALFSARGGKLAAS